MNFDDVMETVSRWSGNTEALAALGAQLALLDSGDTAPPEIVARLKAVSDAACLGDLGELPPPQRAGALGLIRTYLHQAVDLLDHPEKAAGWTYTDTAILDGYGRASAMVPALIAGAHPDLARVTSFLDVGTGVGLLAVAAANVWPDAHVVGLDRWEPSLERARDNVKQAGLEDRITLRTDDFAAVADIESFDCVWIPTFFLAPDALRAGVDALRKALRPGGWVVLGHVKPPADPVAAATTALRQTRDGGSVVASADAIALLEEFGYAEVQTVVPNESLPLELTIGQRAKG